MNKSSSYYEMMHAALQFRSTGAEQPFVGKFGNYRLVSHYQPIVSMIHQRIVGYEALIRPALADQIVCPESLFWQARELGRGAELDRLCRSVHIANFPQPEQPTWLFMNVDMQTIDEEVLPVEFVKHALTQFGMTAPQIVLEIIEKEVKDEARLKDFVQKYKELGFHIAIDDFGKGESNFDRIWKLEPHIVKLDRELVYHACRDSRAQGMLGGLVSLLRQSGCLVLIEGIETETQASIAQAAGADMFQGYYFGKPESQLADERKVNSILSATMRHFRQDQCLKEEKNHRILTDLRLEILGACDQIARGDHLDEACQSLLQCPAVKRCFVLDRSGYQTGKTVGRPQSTGGRSTYNPLCNAEGASWAHRDYFQMAFDRPNQIVVSKPYIALPDVEPTVTFSIYTYTQSGHRVFCVDCNPDELEQDGFGLSNMMMSPSVMGMA